MILNIGSTVNGDTVVPNHSDFVFFRVDCSIRYILSD